MKSSRRYQLFAALFALLLAVMPACAPAASSGSAAPAAPTFALRTLDGDALGSATLSGKAYIVNFFASWCPPCRAEIPDMVALQKKYGPKGFSFIGVAVSDSEVNIREFVRRSGIDYPVAMADQGVVSAFAPFVAGGLRSIPTSFVVDRKGRIIHVVAGARSGEVFEEMILEALGSKPDSK